jgi:hypothetical protein
VEPDLRFQVLGDFCFQVTSSILTRAIMVELEGCNVVEDGHWCVEVIVGGRWWPEPRCMCTVPSGVLMYQRDGAGGGWPRGVLGEICVRDSKHGYK